jgi:D-alanine-D-alanine ligase
MFFDREVKYNGSTMEIVPGRFSKAESDELMRQASLMHEALGLRHYSRSDFMVTPRGIYFLETNTLPGLTTQSLLPKSLAAVGVKFPDFLSHLVELSLGREVHA